MALEDRFGREINYVRIAITDRCNLRCQYCMPAEGIQIVPRKELLTYKEIYRITRALSELGVRKVRLTGGEPFARKNAMSLFRSLTNNDLLDEIHITSNAVLIGPYIKELENIGIKGINVSLDSLQRERFKTITRRDTFDKVMENIHKLIQSKIEVKLNVVVQQGVNTDEIIDFVHFTKNLPIAVRFIEEMPFNGTGGISKFVWNETLIMKEIEKEFPNIITLDTKKSSTSSKYKSPGFLGNFGVIPAYTRSICNDCNRIRITATGDLKNCLYDQGVYSIRDYLREDINNEELKNKFKELILEKPKNGFVAEYNRDSNINESMSSIGG